MKRVLICEDEPLVALDLEQMVYDAGHEPVGPARTFSDALEVADGARPSVAIIDLNLADGMTGASLARLLSQRGIRIIVLSGMTDVIPVLAGIPHVFIPKPVNSEAVTAVLEIEGRAMTPPPTPAVADKDMRQRLEGARALRATAAA